MFVKAASKCAPGGFFICFNGGGFSLLLLKFTQKKQEEHLKHSAVFIHVQLCQKTVQHLNRNFGWPFFF